MLTAGNVGLQLLEEFGCCLYCKMRFLYLKFIFKQNENNMGWQGPTASFIELLIFNCLSAELERLAFEMLCALLLCTLLKHLPVSHRGISERVQKWN